MVVSELFLTETARRADVVLPAAAYTEYEGSLTSAERRVQRFYPAVKAIPGVRSDYLIAAQLGQRLGLDIEGRAPSLVFQRMANNLPAYAGVSYQRMSEVTEQWPLVGRADLYYGGTAYDNHQGLGVQLPVAAAGSAPQRPAAAAPVESPADGQLLLEPITRIYDQGSTLLPTTLLHQRLTPTAIRVSPQTAGRLGLSEGGPVELSAAGWKVKAAVQIEENLPENIALAPRSVGIPITAPIAVAVRQLAPEPEA